MCMYSVCKWTLYVSDKLELGYKVDIEVFYLYQYQIFLYYQTVKYEYII